jgi:hypothetical protein
MLGYSQATDARVSGINNQMSLARKSCLALLAVALAQLCPAQQAGFRDLTAAWRAPDDHVPSPSSPPCPKVNSTISDGVMGDPPGSPAAKDSASLRLTVTALTPPHLRLGDDFSATVRLENVGKTPVLIPWQSDGEKATRTSADGTEEKYEVADISFRIATGRKIAAMPIQSEGALFAYPDDTASYIPLAPGRWLELKLKGSVACGLEECPTSVVADEHAVLTARFYQRILSHRVKDCSEDHGSHKIREVDSAPFPVVLRPAPSPSGGGDANHGEPDLATGTLPGGGQRAPLQQSDAASRFYR